MSGSGLEALLDDREWSGVPPECPEWFGGLPRCPAVIGRSSRVSGSGQDTLPDVLVGWKAFPDVWQLSGGPPGYAGGTPACPAVVGRPYQKFWRPSRKFGNGLYTLPDVPEGWEALPNVRQLMSGPSEYAGGPPSCLRVVGRPSQMTGSGWVALPDVWEASQMSGSNRKALADVREWSGNPPGCS